MRITFWGVRGSIPVAHPDMFYYGGNTACVSIDFGDKTLVLDAGSGIRGLGEALRGSEGPIFLLLTHLHGDHVIGFPFFHPLHEPQREVHLLDYQIDGRRWSPLDLLDGVFFPLRPSDLRCRYHRVEEDPSDYLRRHGMVVSRLQVNHPGGAYGYAIEEGGRRFVFVPDNEIGAACPDVSSEALVAFCQGADVLCHDAQYEQAEMAERRGWGHSALPEVCALAEAAQVRHLVLFHHDPERTDLALDRMERAAVAALEPHGIRCTAAYEGLSLTL